MTRYYIDGKRLIFERNGATKGPKERMTVPSSRCAIAFKMRLLCQSKEKFLNDIRSFCTSLDTQCLTKRSIWLSVSVSNRRRA